MQSKIINVLTSLPIDHSVFKFFCVRLFTACFTGFPYKFQVASPCDTDLKYVIRTNTEFVFQLSFNRCTNRQVAKNEKLVIPAIKIN